MAEFTAGLSQPQAAGAQALAPVQTGVSPVPQLIGNLAGIFAKNLSDRSKQQAEEADRRTLSDYANKRSALNQAMASGQMSPAQAQAHSRALSTQFLANFTHLSEDLKKLDGAFAGMTESEVAVKEEDLLRKARDKAVQQAVSDGFVVTEQTGPQALEAIIRASQANHEADASFKRMRERAEHSRSMSAEERASTDFRNRHQSIKTLNTIGAENVQAATSFILDMARQAREGGNIDALRDQVGTQWVAFESGITAAGAFSPEVASSWRGVFDGIREIADRALDPATNLEDIKRQTETLLARAEFIAVSTNPEAQAVVAASRLFNHQSPSLLGRANVIAIETVAKLASEDFSETNKVPPRVVGQEGVEEDVLKVLSQNANRPDLESDPVLKQQVGNAANNYLRDVGAMLGTGIDSQGLNKAATFIASSEFAKLVDKGIVSRDAMTTAQDVMNIMYEQDVIGGVVEKLETFHSRSETVHKAAGQAPPEKIKDIVDIVFTGSGLDFKLKETGTLSPVQRQREVRLASEVKSTKNMLNRLIHMGAHLEGHTDYQKYWEANKHILIPSMFTSEEEEPAAEAPQGFTPMKIGETRDIGGVSVRRIE